MRLQILVNHYKEPSITVSRLLASIARQSCVDPSDYEVLVYSDGTELYDGVVERFGVRYRSLPHRGVCATRNALMDDADAEYLVFCDADDYFHSSLGLWRILKAIDDLGCDVIGSPYEKELIRDGRPTYEPMRRDTIRVHGKAFKRSFLVENDIRFPDEMEFSGDMYFTWLAYNLGDSAWMPDSFYVWADNPASVTRANPNHRLDTYGVMLRNYELLLLNLEERGRDDLRDALVGSLFSMMCINDCDPRYMDGPDESVATAREAMREFSTKYGHLYGSISDALRKRTYDSSERLHGGGPGVDAVGEWISAITEAPCERSSSGTAR